MKMVLNFLTQKALDLSEWFSKYLLLFYCHYYAAYEHSVSISWKYNMAAQESQTNYGGKLVNKLLLYQSLMLLLILRDLKLISFQNKIYCWNSRDKAS